MKFLAILLILAVVVVSGCVSDPVTSGPDQDGTPDNGDNGAPDNGNNEPDSTPPEPPQEPDPPAEPDIPSIAETISICDSHCRSDADSYCEEERVIEVNGNEVTGTCRAFAKKGNVDGFNRCQGFCASFDSSTTVCSVNGQMDQNCDGVV